MSEPTQLLVAGGAYSAHSLAAAAQDSINCYVEVVEVPGEKSRLTLYGTPGRHLFKDCTGFAGISGTAIRGLWSGNGRCFVAMGARYFEIDSTGALVGTVQTIADDSIHSRVEFFPNTAGDTLFIVSAGYCYLDSGSGPVQCVFPALGDGGGVGIGVSTNGTLVTAQGSNDWPIYGELIGRTITINGVGYTVASTPTTTTLVLTGSAGVQANVSWSVTPLVTASTGTFLNGYFIISRPNSKQINVSEINATAADFVWDPLAYGIKNSYADNIVAVKADLTTLYIFGTESLEFWAGSDNADFPFREIENASIKMGSVNGIEGGSFVTYWAARHPANLRSKIHFISQDSDGNVMAYRLDGYTPKRVSTHAIELIWKTLPFPAFDIIGFPYIEDGHEFWIITSTSGGTQIYDASTEEWTRGSFSGLPYKFHTFIPEWGTSGQHLMNGYAAGTIGETSILFYDDTGNDITVRRAIAHLYKNGRLLFFGTLTIDAETGAGFRTDGTWTVSGVNTGTDFITLSATHGMPAGLRVKLSSTLTLPAPLVAETTYYVRAPSGATLQLAATAGGAAIDLTTAGTGTITLLSGGPDIALDWSSDRGQTFNTPRTAFMGFYGEYGKRIYWNRLGKDRDRVPRLTITGQSKVAITAANWEIDEGAA